MAEELGLPMKKIEVSASADNENIVANPYAHVLNNWQIGRLQWPFIVVPHCLGLSWQSCVDHDVGRVKPDLAVHIAELPHRCCTCFPGKQPSLLVA